MDNVALKLIVLLVIVQAWRIRAIVNPDAHQYHKNYHGAVPEPNKKLSTSERFKMTYRASHRMVQSVKEKGAGVFMTYKGFFWLWNSSMEVLVELVRIRIFNSLNSSCLNYCSKNYAKTMLYHQQVSNDRCLTKRITQQLLFLTHLHHPSYIYTCAAKMYSALKQ